MVVFICGSCGESVKKAAVDKHCQTKCRNCHSLSCIDCGKDFPGESYRTHNQCMTEEEKWHGTDYKPKTGNNTGQKKQDAWVESIQNAIPAAKTSNPHLADALQKLLNYENVPRKEAKFKNFLKNSLRIHNHQIVTAVWAIVGSVKTSPAAAQQKPSANNGTSGVATNKAGEPVEAPKPASPEPVWSTENDSTIEPPKKKSKTAQSDHSNDSVTVASPVDSAATSGTTPERKFRWKKEIRDVLGESPSQTLSQKKLKKKVLRRYETSTDLSAVASDDLNETFEKYLRKYPDLFHVEDKLVKLQIKTTA